MVECIELVYGTVNPRLFYTVLKGDSGIFTNKGTFRCMELVRNFEHSRFSVFFRPVTSIVQMLSTWFDRRQFITPIVYHTFIIVHNTTVLT